MRASTRAMMTKSGSRRDFTAARILPANSSMERSSRRMPGYRLHFLGKMLSSMQMPAMPARSYSSTVRTTLTALP